MRTDQTSTPMAWRWPLVAAFVAGTCYGTSSYFASAMLFVPPLLLIAWATLIAVRTGLAAYIVIRPQP